MVVKVEEMSLSNDTKNISNIGRIIIGLESKELEEIEYRPSYMPPEEIQKRVLEGAQKKAQQKAKEILSQALKEAEQIKKQAFQEGYEAGKKQAEAEVKTLRKELVDKWVSFFNLLEQEKFKIFSTYKTDLVLLVRRAVERVVNFVLETKHEQVIEGLLKEALEFIQNKKELCIKVNPEDKAVLEEVLSQIKQDYPNLHVAQIKTDPNIGRGGVIVENGNGLVDNQVEERLKEIDKILARLELRV